MHFRLALSLAGARRLGSAGPLDGSALPLGVKGWGGGERVEGKSTTG
jgi:hypothetical protein